MGEKMSHAVSYFLFFFPNKMTKTAIGRQWMNNARVPSRPSYGCAINVECGTFESFLAAWLAVVSHVSHCKLGHTAQKLMKNRPNQVSHYWGNTLHPGRLSSAVFVACKAATRTFTWIQDSFCSACLRSRSSAWSDIWISTLFHAVAVCLWQTQSVRPLISALLHRQWLAP